jgi:hypothetical protein
MLVLGVFAALWLAAAAVGAQAQSAQPQQPAARRLVQAYAPITMLRQAKDPTCHTGKESKGFSINITIRLLPGPSGAEEYRPTTVTAVLGNPRVRLVHAGKVVKTAPTAADIAGLGPDYYLDLPGDVLGNLCTYAEGEAALDRAGKAPPVTYAHIATERGKQGLAVQYWFFYYFNEFNDLHEGDWEGMQLTFDAASPQEALARGPDQIALFQHGGGEKASWHDAKVETEGRHPVVYVAAGSHATFFQSAVYVENGGGGAGLGCDNTSRPLDRVRPQPVLVPTNPGQDGPFGWLTYRGHWGQREKGFNNGPQGPNTKRQWLEPFSWMDSARLASPKLPGGFGLGAPVTGAFCRVVQEVSGVLNVGTRSLVGVAVIVVVLILLLAIPAGITKWGPIELTPLRRPRTFGQLLRTARQLYGRHWRTLLAIGLSSIPIIAAVYGIQRVLDAALPGGSVTTTITDAVGTLGRSLGYAVVAAVVITFIRGLQSGRSLGLVDSYREMLQHFWRVVVAQLLTNLIVAALAVTVIGFPVAIWKYVDWQFVQQEILFEDKRIRDAFRGSTRLVRRQWWRAARVAGFLWLLSVAAGPVLIMILIFAHLSLNLIDALGSVIFALLLPYVATGRTLLYFDLAARHQEAVSKPTRRHRIRSRLRPVTGTA